jgi:hypothetical protein
VNINLDFQIKTNPMHYVIPHLWRDRQSKEVVDFYGSLTHGSHYSGRQENRM